jgi:prepilin-type N-terminal cleavage/methylation domain-containing protein
VTVRVRDEAGFSLVEMLVAVTIGGLAMSALALGFGTGSRTFSAASDYVSSATSSRTVAVYFPPDVQAANAVSTSSISCTGASNPKVELTGANGFDVVYGVDLDNGDYVLKRYECASGAVAGTPTVVARNLVGTSAAAATRVPASGTLTGATLTITGRTPSDFASQLSATVVGQVRAS